MEGLEKRLLMARLQGVDVSQFQGTWNPTTAYNWGDRFALIRASRTDTVPDTSVAVNVPAAKAAGLIVGVYHRILPFSNTDDNGAFVDPIVDANNFYSAGGAYMGTGYLHPMVDVENGSSLNSTPVNGYTLHTWVNAFVDRLEALTGVTAMIYCNTNFATSYLNSTVANNVPNLWIANWETGTYGNPVTGSGSPPLGNWASKGWDFWQYDNMGVGSQHGASSARIDLDVFNGSDIDVLKSGFVIGATAIPSGPSPANGATNVAPFNLTLNWNDTAGATRYDVYLDNMTTPIATNIVVSQYTVSSVAGGSHSWKVVAKPASNDDDTWVESDIWTFTASSLPLPGTPANPFPASGALTNTKPLTLDWDDASNATSYQVWSGTTLITTVTASTFGPINPTDGVRPWHVVAMNASGSTTGPAWSFTMDSTAPAASYGDQTPTFNNTFMDFTVTYSDVTSMVNYSTLDSADVRVTGPNGFDSPVFFLGVDVAGNGTPRTVTYRVSAPGGAWDATDNGTYAIVQVANQVKDIAGTGNARTAGNIDTFDLNFASFAYMTGATLNVQFDGTTTPILLATSGANITATRDGTTFNFPGVTAINVIGTALDDILQINGPVAPPMTFNNGAGNDSVDVVGGSYTFANDLSPTARNVAVSVAAGASATFNASQHLRNLSVTGTATLSAGGAKILNTKALTLTGKIDLKDNDFVLDYTANDPSPLGNFDSNTEAYDGMLGMVSAGRNGGGWDGNGFITSMSDAANGITYLGAARAGDLYFIDDTATELFGSETVDGSSIVIKYTYCGDSNLDGTLNGDDYFNIDSNILQSGTIFGQTAGDFNLDGSLNGDDYFLIDGNVVISQNGPIL